MCSWCVCLRVGSLCLCMWRKCLCARTQSTHVCTWVYEYTGVCARSCMCTRIHACVIAGPCKVVSSFSLGQKGLPGLQGVKGDQGDQGFPGPKGRTTCSRLGLADDLGDRKAVELRTRGWSRICEMTVKSLWEALRSMSGPWVTLMFLSATRLQSRTPSAWWGVPRGRRDGWVSNRLQTQHVTQAPGPASSPPGTSSAHASWLGGRTLPGRGPRLPCPPGPGVKQPRTTEAPEALCWAAVSLGPCRILKTVSREEKEK